MLGRRSGVTAGRVRPLFMTVLPTPIIPELIERYTGVQAPANLVALANRKPASSGPEGTNGSAMPPNKIGPYSGIYDANGRLPQILPPGTIFMARV
jgi:hypothetical protein